MKFHFKRIAANTKLMFEELTTVLTQIESCLNSWPLAPLPCVEDGIDRLTPKIYMRSLSILSQTLTVETLVPLSIDCRSLWNRWSNEYLWLLRLYNKWKFPSCNIQVNDIVILQEDNLIATKWPLARVTHVHLSGDGLVCVATDKTSTESEVYKRPVTKLALLLPQDWTLNLKIAGLGRWYMFLWLS